MRTEKFFLAELLSRFHYYSTLQYYSRTTYVVVHRVGYSATSTLPRLCSALCSWWLCFRTTVRWTLGTKQSSTGSWCTLFQNSNFDLLQNLGDPLGGTGSFIFLINSSGKQYCNWYLLCYKQISKQVLSFQEQCDNGSHGVSFMTNRINRNLII